MKKLFLLTLFSLTSTTAFAQAPKIVIYGKNTLSKFPTVVKDYVNRLYASSNCNRNAQYVISKETITTYNDISTFYFNGTLRVYGENDLTATFKEGGRDENGLYRIREFSIKSKNGKLNWSSYGCEVSND